MSRLRIEHSTVYNYRKPVAFGRHRLVLRPREGHDLRVERMDLEITPGHRIVWARDVYNNSVAIVDFTEDAAELAIRSTTVVQRSLPFPQQELHKPWSVALPIEYDVLETQIASVYQVLSYPDDLNEVRLWLARFPEIAAATDAESLLIALCLAITREIKYQRRDIKGVQSPAQTLKLGSGSCRDMATLMMDASRCIGLSARFASGYLDCPASEAGRAAMHAWTEVYLPVLGWRGFDPTIGEPASLKHIVVGVSHHPRGVMPISGLFTGSTSDYIGMNAQVKIEQMGEIDLNSGAGAT
jgi:transglutaminase-like putative cysteine protease